MQDSNSKIATSGIRYAAATLIVMLSVALLPARAGAITWSVNSQISCPGNPRGASWTNWSGGNVFNDAQTRGILYHWNGGNWNYKAESYAEDNGSSGNAQANTSFRYISGTWMQKGTHTADFLANPRTTSDQELC